jgi:hypothetical protein
VPLPPGIETVTVNFGPFPDFQGNLLDGDVTFTPVTQTEYDALTPAVRDDPTILYVITGA